MAAEGFCPTPPFIQSSQSHFTIGTLMNFEVFEKNNLIVFVPLGDMDTSSITRFARELKSLAAFNSRIIFDLKHVGFIDIRSMAMLAEFGRKNAVLEQKERLQIKNVSEKLLYILLSHGLHKYFRIDGIADHLLPCHFSY